MDSYIVSTLLSLFLSHCTPSCPQPLPYLSSLPSHLMGARPPNPLGSLRSISLSLLAFFLSFGGTNRQASRWVRSIFYHFRAKEKGGGMMFSDIRGSGVVPGQGRSNRASATAVAVGALVGKKKKKGRKKERAIRPLRGWRTSCFLRE